MSSKVIPMHSKPTNTKKLIPEAGWELHTRPYGTLKDIRGNPLVRLETVYALLMARQGLTSEQAATRVFGPFTSDTNSELGMKHGADKLRPFLQIVDLTSASFSVSEFAGVRCMDKIAELMPYVPHHHFDEGTPQALFYSLGVMAGEAWAPHGVDVDLNDRLEGWGAEGYFPTMAKAREILGPFAIRHELAHKLWGWGAVHDSAVDAKATTTQLSAAADSSASGAPTAPSTVQKPDIEFTDGFLSLCESRKGRKGDAWTDDEKRTLFIERWRFPKRKKGLFEAMAQALGLDSAEAVRLKVREYKKAQADARQAAANVTQVRGGKKVVNQ